MYMQTSKQENRIVLQSWNNVGTWGWGGVGDGTISDLSNVRFREKGSRIEEPLAPYAEYIQQIVICKKFTINSSIIGMELVKRT